jgi:hypothetical protein
MKKLFLLLFLIPNLTSGDPDWTKVEPGKSDWKAIDTVKKSGLSCFILNLNGQISVIDCENEVVGKSIWTEIKPVFTFDMWD